MKKTKKIIVSIFFILPFVSVCGQNQMNSHNQSSNDKSIHTIHTNKRLSFVDIDTLSYLKINNLIYYKKPIEIHNGVFVNKEYLPEWSEAYLVGQNLEKDPKIILKYLHRSCGIETENDVKRITNDSNSVKLIRDLNNATPYHYVLGEMWLTNKKTNQEFVIVLSKYSAIRLGNYELTDPIYKNNRTEKIDSLRYASYDNFIYIKEDGILKFPDQIYAFGLLENNGTNKLGLTLQHFKDLLFRSTSYKRSNLDGNRKRKFEIMEKKGKQRVVKGIEYKP